MSKPWLLCLPFLLAGPAAIRGDDCDRDGVDDALQIEAGSPDCNGNGVLDVCELSDLASVFRLPLEVPLPSYVHHGITALIDSDSAPDVAVISGQELLVFLNDGSGGLLPQEGIPVRHSAQKLLSGDLGRDEDLDLIVLQPDTSDFEVLLGSGDGAFESRGHFPGRDDDRGSWTASVLSDIDQDGNLDLVIGDDSSPLRVALLENDGSAGFSEPRFLFVGQPQYSALAADLDADGDEDLVIGGSGISIVMNRGGGAFEAPVILREGGDWPTAHILAGGDLDGDGDVDLVFAVREEDDALALFNAGDGTFPTRQTLPAGRSLWSLAIADLNSDGKSDCVASNRGGLGNESDRTVSVLENMGGAPPTIEYRSATYLTGEQPSLALPADMDLDGDLDVVTVNQGSISFSILWNNGQGRLGDSTSVSGLDGPSTIEIVDPDMDGDLDAIVGSYYARVLYVLENVGADGLVRAADVSNVFSVTSLQSADIDDDGLLDLVLSHVNGQTGWVAGKGDLSFEALRQVPLRGNVAVHDLDGDGRLDLIGPDPTLTAISLAVHNGNGDYTVEKRLPVTAHPFSAVARDFDGDGDQDIAASCAGKVVLLEGSGGLEFTPGAEFPIGNIDALEILAVELDGDGFLDLAVQALDLIILWNRGNGEFTAPAMIRPGRRFAAGDLDRDGRTDFINADTTRDAEFLTVLRNTGERSFIPSTTGIVLEEIGALEAADLDGNGSLDLAYSNRLLGTIDFLYSDSRPRSGDCDENGIPDECQMPEQDCNGNGVLDVCELERPAIVLDAPLSAHVGSRPQDVIHGDLDGDGNVDLAATHLLGVSLLENDGTGNFASAGTLQVPNPFALASADADGDGDLDLAATSAESQTKQSVVLLSNRGSGYSLTEAPVGKSPSDVLFSDLDRDGDLEIAVVTCSEVNACGASAITILPVEVDDGATRTTIDLPLRAPTFVAADLNGDSLPDLAACGQFTYLQVLINEGALVFDEPRLVAISPEPSSLVAADLDRDGDLDLAASDRTGSVHAVLNDGAGEFAAALNFPLGPAPLTLTAADLDADGMPDLASGVLETCCPSPLSHLRPLRGTGTGAFVLLPQGPSFGARPRALGSVDLDNDTDLDLYMIDDSGATVLVSLNASSPPSSSVEDCDRNGVPDACELSRDPGLDTDGNGRLDACEGILFRRADTNGDAVTDLSDAVDILGFLFLGTARPDCEASADTNGDGKVDIVDPIVILSYLFLGDSPPAQPFPGCGQGARRGLSCEAPGCP